MTSRRWLPVGGAAAITAGLAGLAGAQTLDTERPRTIVVGAPPGGSRADRLDAARAGRSATAFPAGRPRVAWQAQLGVPLERAPLVDARGGAYVIGTHGELLALSRDGAERWRVTTGGARAGAAALLSDDTVVFVDAAGEAVAVRGGRVRWRFSIGPAEGMGPAPLPLDDGGVVVATPQVLVALDADGNERARASLPEAASAPLLSALGKVVAVTVSGAVWTWAPGSSELTRAGSFGANPDVGAVLADGHTLLAVVGGGTRLAALDLVRHATTTRAIAQGATWLGLPAVGRGTAYVLALGPVSELAVALDPSGRELGRLVLARYPAAAGDAGAPVASPARRLPLLVDPAGTVAFATAEGGVGVAVAMASGGATVDVLTDVCPPPRGGATAWAGPAVAGLAPLVAGTFLAACAAGSVTAVTAPGPPGEPPALRL